MKKYLHYINHRKGDFGMTMECGKKRKQVRFVTWEKHRVTCPECKAKMKEQDNES